MLGAIIGDIVGSIYEWNNIKTKSFDLFQSHCFFTDDTVMTLAIAKAIIMTKEEQSNLSDNAIKYMRLIGQKYPNSGYGLSFDDWMFSKYPRPYNSFGNGAAMRVSACGFVAEMLEECIDLSRKVTEVTHNHKEGLKGAEATAVAIFLARKGYSIDKIKTFIDENYYKMNFSLDAIRDTYRFNETCQDTVPQALMAFFESTSFEDAIRNAISLGGDSDTLAAITGGIAEAYYGIPQSIRDKALTYLDRRLLKIFMEFDCLYPTRIVEG